MKQHKFKTKSKEQAIVIDIHKTIIDGNNNYNNSLLNMINTLSQSYKIVLYTSHLYNDKQELLDELFMINFKFEVYYNMNSDFTDDIEIKKELYKVINNKYNIMFIIDNNKKVAKKLNKKTNVLIFKKRK